MYEVLFAYMLFSSVFCICLFVICFFVIFHFFYLYFCILWQKLGSIIHMNYIYIHYWLLWHILSTHFIVEILCSFMRYFQCFSSPFPAFIIMSICTHSHGSAKHWLHSSLSIHGYMLTSTKIEFLGSLCSSDEIELSVISKVTLCSYRLYFCVKIISVILHVVSCHTCFYV